MDDFKETFKTQYSINKSMVENWDWKGGIKKYGSKISWLIIGFMIGFIIAYFYVSGSCEEIIAAKDLIINNCRMWG